MEEWVMGLVANQMVIEMCYKMKQTIENKAEQKRSRRQKDNKKSDSDYKIKH